MQNPSGNLDLNRATINAIAVRLADELEERGLAIPVATGSNKGLATPKQIAAHEGITRATVHNRINDWSLVRRDAEGFPKEHEGGSTYISWPAWRAREPLPTRTVRRLAGLT